MLTFETPYKSSGCQNGTQNRASGAKMLKKGTRHAAPVYENPVKRIDVLMHLGCPLAQYWCPFRTLWFQLAPLYPFCKILNDSSTPDSANTLLKSGCPQTASIQKCRQSPRRYDGTPNRPSGAQRRENFIWGAHFLSSRETLKH